MATVGKIVTPTGQGYSMSGPEEGKLFKDTGGQIYMLKGGTAYKYDPSEAASQQSSALMNALRNTTSIANPYTGDVKGGSAYTFNFGGQTYTHQYNPTTNGWELVDSSGNKTATGLPQGSMTDYANMMAGAMGLGKLAKNWGEAQAAGYSALGIDPSKLPEWNLGDLGSYGYITSATPSGALTADQIKQLYGSGSIASAQVTPTSLSTAETPKIVSGVNGPVDANGNPINPADYAKLGIVNAPAGGPSNPTSTPQTYVNGVLQPSGANPAATATPGAARAAPAPVNPTTIAPGQRIPGPSYLTGMKETDLARTTGVNIYKRDLAKEQSMMSAFVSLYGKQPATDTDWRLFHDYVYEGKAPGGKVASALPDTSANVDGSFLTGGNEKPPASEAATMLGTGGGVDTTAVINNFLTATTDQLKNTIMATEQQLADAAAKAKAAEQTKLDETTGQLVAASGGFEEKAKALMDQYQLQDKADKLNGVLTEMAKVKESMDMGVIMEGNRIAPMSIIGRRQNTLQEQGAARIGALEAISKVYQGDYDMAKSMADTVFAAFTQDKTAQINALNTLIDLSDKKIVSLSADEKDAINTEMGMLQDQIKTLDDNKNKVLDLITKYPTSAMLGKVGLTDTIEQAMAKMQPYLQAETDASNAKTEIQNIGGRSVMLTYNPNTGEIYSRQDLGKAGSGSSGGGGSSTTLKNPEVFKNSKDETAFWSIVDKGKADLQTGEIWGNVWDRIKLQFPNVPDDFIDTALGTSWRESGAYQGWEAGKKINVGGTGDLSSTLQALGLNTQPSSE